MYNKNKIITISLILFIGCVFQCSGQKMSETDENINLLDSTQADELSTSNLRAIISQEINQSRQNGITRAIAKVSPAVVGINVVQIKRYRTYSWFDDDPFWGWYFGPREIQKEVKGLGSGFIISSDGYIMTNQHVVDEAVEIVVTMVGGKQYKAIIIGEDQANDVALLKIEGNDLPYIALGNSEDIIIGEWAIALGNPFGLFDVNSNPTVTVGVISAIGMDFKEIENHTYNNMIQTDAAINGGNSGGPLVNSQGQCIGINTFIMSGSSNRAISVGIGFAIPMNRVKKILPDLKRIGEINPPFETGLEVENINWLVARMLGISQSDGVIVSRIRQRSEAEKAGLKVGDVIVAINGERVRSINDVDRIIQSIEKVKTSKLGLTIFRNGRLYETEISLR